MTHASVAASVAKRKEQHPEDYCTVKGCLWRVVSGFNGKVTPCRKHGRPTEPRLPLLTREQFDELRRADMDINDAYEDYAHYLRVQEAFKIG